MCFVEVQPTSKGLQQVVKSHSPNIQPVLKMSTSNDIAETAAKNLDLLNTLPKGFQLLSELRLMWQLLILLAISCSGMSLSESDSIVVGCLGLSALSKTSASAAAASATVPASVAAAACCWPSSNASSSVCEGSCRTLLATRLATSAKGSDTHSSCQSCSASESALSASLTLQQGGHSQPQLARHQLCQREGQPPSWLAIVWTS